MLQAQPPHPKTRRDNTAQRPLDLLIKVFPMTYRQALIAVIVVIRNDVDEDEVWFSTFQYDVMSVPN